MERINLSSFASQSNSLLPDNQTICNLRDNADSPVKLRMCSWQLRNLTSHSSDEDVGAGDASDSSCSVLEEVNGRFVSIPQPAAQTISLDKTEDTLGIFTLSQLGMRMRARKLLNVSNAGAGDGDSNDEDNSYSTSSEESPRAQQAQRVAQQAMRRRRRNIQRLWGHLQGEDEDVDDHSVTVQQAMGAGQALRLPQPPSPLAHAFTLPGASLPSDFTPGADGGDAQPVAPASAPNEQGALEERHLRGAAPADLEDPGAVFVERVLRNIPAVALDPAPTPAHLPRHGLRQSKLTNAERVKRSCL